MIIDPIIDPLQDFVVSVISHKFYQSIKLNSVPCISMDVSYKHDKKDHTYDLEKLLLQKIMENLGAIRRSKGAQYKFGLFLVYILIYVLEEFPSIGKVN